MKNNTQLISITDTNGRYIYVNNHFCEHSGFSEELLLTMSRESLLADGIPQQVLAELNSTLKQGLSWKGVLGLKTQQGQNIWLDAFVTPQYKNGKIIGYQSISTFAEPSLQNKAKKVYKALKDQQSLASFELTKNHKFLFLVAISVVSQLYIFTQLGLLTSVIAAISAFTPIVIFWQDIIPTAIRAQQMQNISDPISRKIYFGKGTVSVIDFNFSMIKTKLKAILERSLDCAKPIKSVMERVTQGIDSTRSNLELQKHEIQQLSVAMNQMNLSTTEIAENAVTAASDLESTFGQCEEAQQDINQTTENIKHLSKEVEAASASAGRLTESANGVGELMEDIQSIADQTNLLALNAAIEAARAGEQGRGFAVVADEVRNLSSRTQGSAQEIHKRLTIMLETIEDWVNLMNKNKEEAEKCVDAAESSNQKINQVVDKVQNVAAVANQIAASTEQQSTVSNEINSHIEELHLATERTWSQTDIVSEQMQVLEKSVEDITDVASTFMPQRH